VTEPGELRRPRAGRTAPVALVVMLLSLPLAGAVGLWGLDGILHCDEAFAKMQAGLIEKDCGLGFAVLIPLGWLAGAAVACVALGLALVRLPRAAARAIFLGAAAVIWLIDLGAMFAYSPG
jgi:hypothetical protein